MGRTENKLNENIDLLNINDTSTMTAPTDVKVNLFNIDGDIKSNSFSNNNNNNNNVNSSEGGSMADLLGGFSDFVSHANSVPIPINATSNINSYSSNDSFNFDPFAGTASSLKVSS